jgi:hypothetical protein
MQGTRSCFPPDQESSQSGLALDRHSLLIRSLVVGSRQLRPKSFAGLSEPLFAGLALFAFAVAQPSACPSPAGFPWQGKSQLLRPAVGPKRRGSAVHYTSNRITENLSVDAGTVGNETNVGFQTYGSLILFFVTSSSNQQLALLGAGCNFGKWASPESTS